MRMLPRVIKPLLYICLLLMLAGCVEARFVLEINEDLSSNMEVTLGMDRGLAAMVGASGQMPDVDESMGTVERWIEGDYEWERFSRTYATLEELQSVLTSNEFFQEFTIVREGNRLHVDAIVARMPNADEMAMAMAGGMIDVRFLLKVPGEVVETNGILDVTYDAYSWSILGSSPTTISLESQLPMRWTTVLLVAAATLAVLAIVVAVIVTVLVRRRQRSVAPESW